MNELMQDPMFFYAIAFVIFLALAFIYGRKPAAGWLDGEIARIRGELDAARELRAEAEAALADCKEKQARAEADAKTIVKNAQEQVEEMRRAAGEELAATLRRHQQLAAERIRMAEFEAVNEVRAAAIKLAMDSARQSLSGLSDTDAARLVDQAIGEIPAIKGKKAEAA